MYTSKNFRTKKALKDAVSNGEKITVFQPNSMFGNQAPRDGRVTLEGPHYPEPHKWYAQAMIENGYIVSVK